MDHALDYPTVCQYVGQLYLESRAQIELMKAKERDLGVRLEEAVRQRDEAVAALAKKA